MCYWVSKLGASNLSSWTKKKTARFRMSHDSDFGNLHVSLPLLFSTFCITMWASTQHLHMAAVFSEKTWQCPALSYSLLWARISTIWFCWLNITRESLRKSLVSLLLRESWKNIPELSTFVPGRFFLNFNLTFKSKNLCAQTKDFIIIVPMAHIWPRGHQSRKMFIILFLIWATCNCLKKTAWSVFVYAGKKELHNTLQ